MLDGQRELAQLLLGHLAAGDVVDPADQRRAAELGHTHKIAACDALVYATAEARGVALMTADPDLQGLPGVVFHEKPGASGVTKKAKRGAGRASEEPR